MKIPCLAACCVAALVASWPAAAENWPQWRGPAQNGSTPEAGLPATWSKTENVRWVVPLPGPGASTPAVWGNRVFLTAVDYQTKHLMAIALNASTGKPLWQKDAGPDRPAMSGNTMATPSPVTDGKTVWFFFGTGTLLAFDYSGKELWSRDLEKDYGSFVIKYGYSCSPLLYRGRLYIPVLQNDDPARYHGPGANRKAPLDSFVLAIDGATGKTVWKQVRANDATDESREGYLTPVSYEYQGQHEVIVPGGECLAGYDPNTGAELWRWWYTPRDRKVWQRQIPSAVPGDGLIYVARPRHRGVFAIRPVGAGELPETAVAWSAVGPAPDVLTPLLYQSRLYTMQDDERLMACLDARTGKQLWSTRLAARAPIHASPTGADGRVYCISEDGQVFVVADGDDFKLIAHIDMGESPCETPIVAADHCLFIRTGKNLYCIGAAGGTH